MKAMLLEFPGPIADRPLKAVELPPPVPGPGQVLLKLSHCALCHTDLHLVEGELPPERLPVIPGHQAVGEVMETGPGVTTLHPGDRVGVTWLFRACGVCQLCLRGREHLCPAAEFTGLHQDGGYGEQMVADAAFVHPLPRELPGEVLAPLLGAGGFGYRALRRAELRPGQRLGLFGFGSSAHLTLQLARAWGCEVLVFTRSPEHQELARELGAAWVGSPQSEPPAPLHAAILFAPAGALVPRALQALERGGTLVLAGLFLTAIPTLQFHSHLVHEKTLRGVMGVSRREGREFLELAARLTLIPRVQVFPLGEANEALGLLKAGKIKGSAVLAVD